MWIIEPSRERSTRAESRCRGCKTGHRRQWQTCDARFLSRRQSRHCDDYGRAKRRLHHYTITAAGLVSAPYSIASVGMQLDICCRVAPSRFAYRVP
ncbi:hypothetical protein ANCCAN_25103 [Ancylostoma caninum]|uniref:Uncharacterized protein n=1 Tax=Ancylostoma caninum TaxID=29170 RepID=A0A368FAC4_ANCCA|nr:hypothetical protein ANCCAN_25103 [Ancylostoma caninum]